MSNQAVTRRRFLKQAGLLTVAAAGSVWLPETLRAAEGVAVPNSSGTNAPKYKVPTNTCDCHFHIYDPQAAGH
jgi:hypothetical protein